MRKANYFFILSIWLLLLWIILANNFESYSYSSSKNSTKNELAGYLAIFTDKHAYKKGELVKITVLNNSTEPLKVVNTNSLTIGNLQTGESYSPSSVPTRSKILLPGESVKFEWDQRLPLINSSKQVNSGNYTVSVPIGEVKFNATFNIS